MIFLNHKMNLTLDEVNNYIEALKNYKEKIIVLPTALYAKEFINSGYKVGLQNIYYEEKVKEKINYYIDTLIYFQNNIDKIDRTWASFLSRDEIENKEKLLWEKKIIRK